jgi:hypothetical protein
MQFVSRSTFSIASLCLFLTTATAPASGQGINQGFEDVHAISIIIAAAKGQNVWTAHLAHWQQYRSGRVERIHELTNRMSQRRLPGWDGEDGGSIDGSWLFGVEIEKDFRNYLASQA